MENKGSLKFILSVLVVAAFAGDPTASRAYAIPTHHNLTETTFAAYEKLYGETFSDAETNAAAIGSEDEDTLESKRRPLNHFYDPINDTGLKVFGLINIQNVSSGLASPIWATDTEAQANFLKERVGYTDKYFSSPTDFSWDRAVYEYAHGDKERGVKTLGHILHLMQDTTSPAHVRNDDHLFFDPYEAFTDGMHPASDFRITKNELLNDDTIGGLIKDSAFYVNTNFLSEDTVFDGYDKPSRIGLELSNSNDDGRGQYFGIKNNLHLVRIKIEKDWLKNENIETYFLQDQKNLILTDYWNALSRQAIIGGVSAIKLFLQDVEKEKKTLALADKNKSEAEIAMAKMIPSAFSLIRGFYGSSLELQDVQELSGDQNQAGAAILATQNEGSVVPPPTPPIKTAAVEPVLAPIIAIAPTPIPPVAPIVPKPISPTYVETVPDWYPRQAGSLSRDSGGGGAATNNSQPTTNNAGATIASDSSASVATTTASTTPVVIADTTAPDIALTINECTASLSVGGCLLTSGNITASWSSAASDLAEFELAIDGAIIPLASATSTSATTTLADNATHTIAVRAKDLTGNWSASETKNITISSRPVVINEVAWAGTENGHPNDEWLELYNRTDQDISLANWTLYSSSQKPYINLANTIRAKSYFLLERTDDNTVSDIPADQIYGNGGSDWALNSSGEILYLARASTTIDQTVLCGSGSYKWCPGSDYRYMTMERKDPDTIGTVTTNWNSNYYPSILVNGKTASGGIIYGTPKARNSQNYFFTTTGTIATNLTLTKAKSPYVVTNNITVNSGATLRMEPGVTIKFSGGSLTVNGTLDAQGTASEPIVFTILTDDTYGGDTNGDATTTTPAPGSWYGVALKQGSDASVISNAIFRYAGLYYTGQTQHMANLYIENSSPTIQNSTFEFSKIYGLKTQTSSSTIANNIIRNNNNATDPAGIDAGMYVAGGAPILQNNTVSGNHRGLFFTDASGTVSGNNFTNHTREAIYSISGAAIFSNNSGASNYLNGILLAGNVSAGTLTLAANSLSYIPNDWTIPANSIVNVNSGVVFKPQGRINVFGNFNLNGAVPSDIVFTSPYDDTVGGDATNDAGANAPRAGNWRGVVVKSGGTFTGAGFTMKYGGCIYNGCDLEGALTLENGGGMASLHGALFESNYPFGIYSARGTIAVTDSIFQNHTPPVNAPGWSSAAFASYESTTTLTNVAFNNNKLGATGYVSIPWIVSGVSFLNNVKDMLPTNLF